MKKGLFVVICLLLSACDSYINEITPEYHDAATNICANNSGYKTFKVWKQFKAYENEHLVVICNDMAEFYVYRVNKIVDGKIGKGEWTPDDMRKN